MVWYFRIFGGGGVGTSAERSLDGRGVGYGDVAFVRLFGIFENVVPGEVGNSFLRLTSGDLGVPFVIGKGWLQHFQGIGQRPEC